ncbi:MAG TPA: hypothetical protein VLE94_01070 [Burkholderiaceae bacterium]|nr:hypothetical protein [Burkholderiaceae bacterium]HSC00625.1 hypothetical protein [Burkholderiaceae bacterium]
MDISRKRFVEALASGGALLLLSGCGGGGYSSGGSTVMATSSCSGDIAANHGHVLPIAVADLSSASPKTYDITGTATHSHSVTLSVAQLGQLRAGTAVTVTSTPATTDGHTHAVTVSCIIY